MQLSAAIALLVSLQGLEAGADRARARTKTPTAPAAVSLSVGSRAEQGVLPAEYLWQDFDRDGRGDVYVRAPGQHDRLLRNTGAEFVDVTDVFGLAERGSSLAADWIDFEADGLPDLYLVTERGASRLLHNAGTAFVDVTDASGAAHSGRVWFHEWIDNDGDRLPDLHLVGDQGDVLYRNLGQGRFAALTLPAGPAGFRGHQGRGIDGGTMIVAPGPPDGAGDRGDATESHSAGASSATPRSGPRGSTGNASENLGTCGTLDIDDQGAAGCLQASSVATLGMLYPLSTDLNVDGTGNVGIGTTTPTQKLDVDGTIRSRSGGIEFPDGSTQTTAEFGIAASAFAAGNAPDPTATLQFLVPPATVTVAAGQKVFVTSHRGMGTRNQGGACCLSLWIGHRLTPAGPVIAVGPGMLGNKTVRNTRTLYSCCAVISSLAPGTYEVGLIGGSSDAIHWDSNGAGYTSALVFD